MKVFLGGTCNESKWREELIEGLEMDYFNPVVEDWTPDCQEEEIYQREHCDYVLYTITPKMKGVYSIAEVVDDSNKRPKKTILCILDDDIDGSFSMAQLKSLKAVGSMVRNNGGFVVDNLRAVRHYLNHNI